MVKKCWNCKSLSTGGKTVISTDRKAEESLNRITGTTILEKKRPSRLQSPTINQLRPTEYHQSTKSLNAIHTHFLNTSSNGDSIISLGSLLHI